MKYDRSYVRGSGVDLYGTVPDTVPMHVVIQMLIRTQIMRVSCCLL
jgi:hypothetical protein